MQWINKQNSLQKHDDGKEVSRESFLKTLITVNMQKKIK